MYDEASQAREDLAGEASAVQPLCGSCYSLEGEYGERIDLLP